MTNSPNKNRKRIAVFIDGSSFYYLQRDCLRWWIDPSRILDWIDDNLGSVTDANYYASLGQDNNNNQHGYLTALAHNGFRVVTKNVKIFDRPDGTKGYKTSVEIDIIIDMFNTIDNYDEVVLVSGSGEYAKVMETLRARGKSIFVISTKGVIGSDLLFVAGSNFRDLADMRPDVEKNPN